MGAEMKMPEEMKVETAEKEEKKAVAMGEKEKEEKKKGEKDGGEKKAEEDGQGDVEEEEKKDEPPPPPPEEIIMKIYMHCEGCARKVQRSLRGFAGVEGVMTDCRVHKVVVKGQVAAADPLKVVERLMKKTGRKVELLTPIPPKPEKKEEKKEEEKPKPEEKKEEPQVIAVFLKVHMHCEACSQEIKKRIQKMKGVQSVDSDLKASQVKVIGVFDPTKLVEYVYKRTGKHAIIFKVENEAKSDDKAKDEKKGDGDGKKDAGDEKDDKGGDDKPKEGDDKPKEGEIGGEKDAKDDLVSDELMAAAMKFTELKNDFYYYYPEPRYNVEYAAAAAYPPQIFSDENPNACSVM